VETLANPLHTGDAELLRAHREAWAAAACGDGAADLGEGLDALATADAAVWLEGYEPAARPALAKAAARGARLVIAVPASGEARELAEAIGGESVPQALAGGSVIGGATEATVVLDAPATVEYAVWHLVCANVALDGAEARLGIAAGAGLSARVTRLESALAALQEANVRLAREQLGRHDAAAASIIGRLEEQSRSAKEWEERFLYEQQLAIKHHEWFMDAQKRLQSRRYRAIDKLAGAAGRLPGRRRR
jgi:hypothetical protein